MKTVIILILTLFTLTTSIAQEQTVSGIVTSKSDGLPLPGVNVIIKGTTKGVQTNFDGLYTIQVKLGETLVFSFVSMVSTEVVVASNTIINVALVEDAACLDEVFVTAYGTSKIRRNYTSSASQIKRQKQKAYHNKLASQLQSQTVVQTLQGSAAGVQVNSNIGNPGSSTRIILRGNTSIQGSQKPMVIIDGVVSTYEAMEALDPNNIQSVNVLKGVNAASIYGNRAQDGIVSISTATNTNQTDHKPLYIVDGVPISKDQNFLIENLQDSQIDSKKIYKKAEAKQKFGQIAKHGCIVITTPNGNFRLNNQESYAVIEENNFENTALSPLSTFSIDVDKASYTNIRRMLNNGESIPVDAVKIEEMVNYFNYNYVQPTDKHPFAIHTEVAQTFWNNTTKIVKIGLQGKTYANEDLPASNLTFLLDVSGSMGSEHKLPLLKSAFKLLVNQLREKDKVAIVVYAGAAGLVLPPTSGAHKEKIMNALDQLNAGGSTAGGAGIELAYHIAQDNFIKNGNNRVILATDGDFNVGVSSDKAMETLIEEKRKSGVFLSVLGFGYGNYKDSKLETLADKGNGNHAYIDTMQEAQKVFGKEFGGTLFTIAKDVKIQVEFNPKKVQAYRLLGYENRLLADEDFIDDTKDAGELGSGHTVTALYEVIPVGVKSKYLKTVNDLKYTQKSDLDHFSDELFTVKFRYKKPDGDKSIEMVHVQKDEVSTETNDLKFASAVALFGMQLRHSKYSNNTTLNTVVNLAKSARGDDKDGYRAEFVRLVESYQNM